MGILEGGLEGNIITAKLDSVINRARKSSIWPMSVSCSISPKYCQRVVLRPRGC